MDYVIQNNNSYIEVFVTFDDELTVTIIVGTSNNNLEYTLTKDRVNFYPPKLPWIIVKELTVEIIYKIISITNSTQQT